MGRGRCALQREVQRERLPEIELSLVRYLEEFLAVADVIRQYVRVVPELGMIMDRAFGVGRRAMRNLKSKGYYRRFEGRCNKA